MGGNQTHEREERAVSLVTTKKVQGPLWTINAESESGQKIWATVVAVRPEVALAMFRSEWPGHEVIGMTRGNTEWVVTSA